MRSNTPNLFLLRQQPVSTRIVKTLEISKIISPPKKKVTESSALQEIFKKCKMIVLYTALKEIKKHFNSEIKIILMATNLKKDMQTSFEKKLRSRINKKLSYKKTPTEFNFLAELKESNAVSLSRDIEKSFENFKCVPDSQTVKRGPILNMHFEKVRHMSKGIIQNAQKLRRSDAIELRLKSKGFLPEISKVK